MSRWKQVFWWRQALKAITPMQYSGLCKCKIFSTVETKDSYRILFFFFLQFGVTMQTTVMAADHDTHWIIDGVCARL